MDVRNNVLLAFQCSAMTAKFEPVWRKRSLANCGLLHLGVVLARGARLLVLVLLPISSTRFYPREWKNVHTPRSMDDGQLIWDQTVHDDHLIRTKKKDPKILPKNCQSKLESSSYQ